MNYNELETYIKKLFNQYFNKYRMSLDDKKDIIQNSMLQLFRKEQDGTLVGSVEDNKNYIFITVRNFVLGHVYPKKNIVEYREILPDTHNSSPTIEKDMDNIILSNIIRKSLKSKRFTPNERTIINGILSGFSFTEMNKMLGKTENYSYGLSNITYKIKNELNPTIRYLVIYDDKTIGFKSKKDMSKHLKMSIEQINNYLSLGKTIFPKYKIQIL